jgi:hypothetical protein
MADPQTIIAIEQEHLPPTVGVLKGAITKMNMDLLDATYAISHPNPFVC